MEKAKSILKRILHRKLYQHLGTYTIPLKAQRDNQIYKELVSMG